MLKRRLKSQIGLFLRFSGQSVWLHRVVVLILYGFLASLGVYLGGTLKILASFSFFGLLWGCRVINEYVFIDFFGFSGLFEGFFLDFGARPHGFSLRILKNHVLGVFSHFGFHPQVLAPADIWNFGGHIFTKIQYSDSIILWCQKYPMDFLGKNDN